jgi:hypothetical protein
VLTRTGHDHQPASVASQRRVPTPRHDDPSERDSASRDINQGFKRFHPSGLPLACGSRMEREPLGFAPSFAPRPYGRRTSGWGQAIEHEPETRFTASAEPPTSRVYLIRATSCRTRERRSLGPPCQSAQIPQNQRSGNHCLIAVRNQQPADRLSGLPQVVRCGSVGDAGEHFSPPQNALADRRHRRGKPVFLSTATSPPRASSRRRWRRCSAKLPTGDSPPT